MGRGAAAMALSAPAGRYPIATPMTNLTKTALLPAGLRDDLPEEAAFEAKITERLMAAFAGRGYERVKPPLIEFEESLFAGGGQAMAVQAFRLTDPMSQRMLALRPDMTLQVARIATTRLARRPRPLRLGYAGQVLRITGSQLRPERQFGQAGAEIIGAPAPEGEVEVILMGVEALDALGVQGLSADLGMPALTSALLDTLSPPLEENIRLQLRRALDHKDTASVAALEPKLGKEVTSILLTMLASAGPAAHVLDTLENLNLPKAVAAKRQVLAKVIRAVAAGAPDLTLTADLVENRGFEYHTGVTFTLFARNVCGELGRGGRYLAGHGQAAETAAGLTLFMDTIHRAIPGPKSKQRVFLPKGTAKDIGRRLRAEGWITLQGLTEVGDLSAEARRLGCSHILEAGAAVEIK